VEEEKIRSKTDEKRVQEGRATEPSQKTQGGMMVRDQQWAGKHQRKRRGEEVKNRQWARKWQKFSNQRGGRAESSWTKKKRAEGNGGVSQTEGNADEE